MQDDAGVLGAASDEQSRRIERLEADLKRAEAFAASSFVLTVMLIREMLAERRLSSDRAIDLVRAAIGFLQRMYRVGEVDPFESDIIDYEKLRAAMSNAEHESGAEELLKELLVALGGHRP